MAAGIGEASAIFTVAETGFKLSSAILAYIREAREAPVRITRIANDIETTSEHLKQVGELIENNHRRKVLNEFGIRSAQRCADECSEILRTIRVIVCKHGWQQDPNGIQTEIDVSLFSAIQWPFVKPKLTAPRAELDRIKLDLTLILTIASVLQAPTLAEQARRGQEIPALERARDWAARRAAKARMEPARSSRRERTRHAAHEDTESDSEDEKILNDFITYQERRFEEQEERRRREEAALIAAEEAKKMKEAEEQRQTITEQAREEFKEELRRNHLEREERQTNLKKRLHAELLKIEVPLAQIQDITDKVDLSIDENPDAVRLMAYLGQRQGSSKGESLDDEASLKTEATSVRRNSSILPWRRPKSLKSGNSSSFTSPSPGSSMMAGLANSGMQLAAWTVDLVTSRAVELGHPQEWLRHYLVSNLQKEGMRSVKMLSQRCAQLSAQSWKVLSDFLLQRNEEEPLNSQVHWVLLYVDHAPKSSSRSRLFRRTKEAESLEVILGRQDRRGPAWFNSDSSDSKSAILTTGTNPQRQDFPERTPTPGNGDGTLSQNLTVSRAQPAESVGENAPLPNNTDVNASASGNNNPALPPKSSIKPSPSLNPAAKAEPLKVSFEEPSSHRSDKSTNDNFSRTASPPPETQSHDYTVNPFLLPSDYGYPQPPRHIGGPPPSISGTPLIPVPPPSSMSFAQPPPMAYPPPPSMHYAPHSSMSYPFGPAPSYWPPPEYEFRENLGPGGRYGWPNPPSFAGGFGHSPPRGSGGPLYSSRVNGPEVAPSYPFHPLMEYPPLAPEPPPSPVNSSSGESYLPRRRSSSGHASRNANSRVRSSVDVDSRPLRVKELNRVKEKLREKRPSSHQSIGDSESRIRKASLSGYDESGSSSQPLSTVDLEDNLEVLQRRLRKMADEEEAARRSNESQTADRLACYQIPHIRAEIYQLQAKIRAAHTEHSRDRSNQTTSHRGSSRDRAASNQEDKGPYYGSRSIKHAENEWALIPFYGAPRPVLPSVQEILPSGSDSDSDVHPDKSVETSSKAKSTLSNNETILNALQKYTVFGAGATHGSPARVEDYESDESKVIPVSRKAPTVEETSEPSIAAIVPKPPASNDVSNASETLQPKPRDSDSGTRAGADDKNEDNGRSYYANVHEIHIFSTNDDSEGLVRRDSISARSADNVSQADEQEDKATEGSTSGPVGVEEFREKISGSESHSPEVEEARKPWGILSKRKKKKNRRKNRAVSFRSVTPQARSGNDPSDSRPTSRAGDSNDGNRNDAHNAGIVEAPSPPKRPILLPPPPSTSDSGGVWQLWSGSKKKEKDKNRKKAANEQEEPLAPQPRSRNGSGTVERLEQNYAENSSRPSLVRSATVEDWTEYEEDSKDTG